jgi:hypothetical protein
VRVLLDIGRAVCSPALERRRFGGMTLEREGRRVYLNRR